MPRTSWLPIGIYCFLSTFSIFYEDCYPLWLLTPRMRVAWAIAVDEIGAVLSATAVFTVAYQFLIFPFISERCPSHVLFPTSAGISAVLMPVAVLIARMKPGAATTWAALIVHNIVYRCAVSNAYTACFCTINNSCATDARGAVNGFAMSVASLFKAVGPSLGASLYAYGLDRAPNGGVGVLAVFGGVGAALGVTALVACKYMGGIRHAARLMFGVKFVFLSKHPCFRVFYWRFCPGGRRRRSARTELYAFRGGPCVRAWLRSAPAGFV